VGDADAIRELQRANSHGSGLAAGLKASLRDLDAAIKKMGESIRAELEKAGLGEADSAACLHCLDEGFVCEDHSDMPWEGEWGTVEGHAEHGGAGMPCPYCCSAIPEDGTTPITLAFVPDWKRA